MSLVSQCDLQDPNNGSTFTAAEALNGILYVVSDQPRLHAFSMETGAVVYTSSSLVAAGSGIAFISSLSGVVVSSSTSSVNFVELSTGYFTTVSTGASTSNLASRPQQVAGNPSTGYAVMSRSATSSVILINGNTQALSTLSPSILSGVSATVVTRKDNNFIIGTSNGKVFEMDTSGTVVSSATLPATPVTTGTVTMAIRGVAYYNDYLLVTTDRGLTHLYKWSTTTIVDTQYWANSYSYLNHSVSGHTFLVPGGSISNTSVMPLVQVYFANGTIEVDDSVVLQDFNGNPCRIAGMDASSGRPWVLCTTTTFKRGKIFQPVYYDDVLVETRYQSPAGTDVNARIIRMRDPGLGKAFVESDTNITAGAYNIRSTRNRHSIEVGLYASETDVRELDS